MGCSDVTIMELLWCVLWVIMEKLFGTVVIGIGSSYY